MLKVRGLSRDGKLGPADFDLDDGECVAVMGPSGGGKTLLLRAVADLDPAEGELSLDGEDRARTTGPAWRRQVTYLPSESGWWYDMVGEHFADREAAAELLPELRLPKSALDWSVTRLSTGERQRLALLRVLVQRPKVMLLDEPTSGLDQEATEIVERVLKNRLGEGTAILMVTHGPEQARRMARRALMIEAGQVKETRL